VRLATPSDIRAIKRWLQLRGHPPIAELPSYYVVVPGVAALGIWTISRRAVLLDSLVSNPHVTGLTRNRVIDELVTRVLEDIEASGFKRIIALSEDENTINRAIKHGFEKLPHTVLSKG